MRHHRRDQQQGRANRKSVVNMIDQVRLLALIIGITVLSGLGDAQGFLHAANIWQNGSLRWEAVAKSAAGFAFGISLYWISIRFLQQFGVFSAETQTILWFGVTLTSVALFSGRFFQWVATDQFVAIAVLAGIGWLLLRTGG
jgi:hypothetical protein